MQSKSVDKKAENMETFAKHYQTFKSKDVSQKALVKKTEDFEKLVELFIWGEKNGHLFADPFMESNILGQFLTLLKEASKSPANKGLVLTLIRSYSFLVTNIKRHEMVSYAFSHPTFNNFIKFPFDFRDDEIVFYYINFVKSLSQRFDSFPLQIFYNQVSSAEAARVPHLLRHRPVLRPPRQPGADDRLQRRADSPQRWADQRRRTNWPPASSSSSPSTSSSSASWCSCATSSGDSCGGTRSA